MVYLLSIVLSMLLWWANPADVAAAGNTYYASPRGSDSNPCSQSSPYSLGTGIARLQAGDTLILQGGTYSNPPLVIPTSASGSAGAHTRMRVSDGATVILYGDINLGDDLHDFTIDGLNGTLILDGQQTGGGIYTARASNMRFEQFEIRWTVMGFQGGFYNSEFIRLHIHHFGVDENGALSLGCWNGVAREEGRTWTNLAIDSGTYVGS
jgi:hypothetical protein